MKDEEVGEQWKDWEQARRFAADELDLKVAEGVCALIVKLVEERKLRNQSEAWLRWFINGQEGPSPSMILPHDTEIASGFGIDPATWPKDGA